MIAAEVDELVGPVETDFGFHIIKVTGYENSAAIEERFTSMFDNVEVFVDPAFGTWNVDTQAVVDTATP
ncbi:MAG: hypothetical protein R2710_09165 [Acidimicrobiales bacterium]